MLIIRLICRFSKCSVEIKQKGMVQDLLDVAILSIGTFDMNRLFFQDHHSVLLQRFYACLPGIIPEVVWGISDFTGVWGGF